MKSFNIFAITFAICTAPLASTAAWSSADHDKHVGKTAVAAPAGEAVGMTNGEVRKVDKDAKKITLKHGEIKNLDMPAMTMVFQVKDTALLDKVKAGDKVKFKAEKIAGGYAVSEVELAK